MKKSRTFRKYERTFRIKVPQFEISSKHHLSRADHKRLLNGKIVIEEKIDGANVGIIRTKKAPGFKLQRRGGLVGPSEHAQFNYFVNLIHSCIPQVLEIPRQFRVYGELMYAQHHIKYDKLPCFFIVFDVWDDYDQEYLSPGDLTRFCMTYKFERVPILYYGPAPNRIHLVDFIPKISAYATKSEAEGLVVKNYRQQIRGKLVRPSFVKDLDESDHWTNQTLRRNTLDENSKATALQYPEVSEMRLG